MPADLTISLDGDEQSVQPFIDSIASTLEILRDLDSRISQRRRGTIRWLLKALNYGSPATITIRAAPPPAGRDVSNDVIRHYLDGLDALARGGKIPELFSENALRAAQRLSRLVSEARMVTVRTDRRQVEITPRIASNVDELISRSYHSGGSVEGVMEMVTLHENHYFRVYDAVHGWGVACYFPEDMVDDVRAGWGRRVSVTGRLRSDRLGKPETMQVESLRVLARDDELPSPSQLRGIAKGMTGGRRAEDYLRAIRGDDS